MSAAEAAGDIGRGNEAKTKADRIEVELTLAPGARTTGLIDGHHHRRPCPIVAVDLDDDRVVHDRHPRASKGGAIAKAVADQAGIGERHPRQRPQPSPRRCLGELRDPDDRSAARGQLGGDLQVERPVAGHEDSSPWRDPVAAPQRLRRAGRHHSGQRPAQETGLHARRRPWPRSPRRRRTSSEPRGRVAQIASSPNAPHT